MNIPIRNVDLYFALQVMSGRITFEMMKKEPTSIFQKCSNEFDMKAMAEMVLFKAIVGHEFHDCSFMKII